MFRRFFKNVKLKISSYVEKIKQIFKRTLITTFEVFSLQLLSFLIILVKM